MSRIKQVVKAEDNGKAVGIFKRPLRDGIKFFRLSMKTSLVVMMFVATSGNANALSFTFDYTYTIVANTCNLSPVGISSGSFNGGQTGEFTVDWGELTKKQLTGETKSEREFGIKMKCQGDIYNPILTISAANSKVADNILYISDEASSVLGFGVRFSSKSTDYSVLSQAGQANGISLQERAPENEHLILLVAWPTLMPGKSIKDISGTAPLNINGPVYTKDIVGTVTMTVRYN